MEKEIFVYIDIGEQNYLVGQLWTRNRRGRESATFEYSHSWLKHPDGFALEPALMLLTGPHHTPIKKAIFGSFGDSAPDRWGRLLMRRAERRRAEKENQAPRTLMEIDYLLLVNDHTRQGALRFSMNENGPFLNNDHEIKIPPLLELPKLLSATESFISDNESDEDLILLLAPGSSLGGARPKASIIDKNGQLAIAKFPHKDDENSTVLWEALALKLASLAKITVPLWRVESIDNKKVLILDRFDREGSRRFPYLSAMSMLGATDTEQRSYLEIVDALRLHGSQPTNDLHELWRRLVFNIMISNTDDHLRNHGFLYIDRSGWQLSPAFDMNPTPTDIKPRILTTTIDYYDGTASLDLAMSVIEYFGLTKVQAQSIAKEVAEATSSWKEQALKIGIPQNEIARMTSAFVHNDLKQALQY